MAGSLTNTYAEGASKVDKMNNNNHQTDESIHSQFKVQADTAVIMQLFQLIEEEPNISERRITNKTGLASGLVHSFMKKIISKGWVRAKKVNSKRWAYFLTPEGFLEKSRISMNYISRVYSEYREIQNHVANVLDHCFENSWGKIAVTGKGELSEIVLLNIKVRDGLEVVGLFNDTNHGEIISTYEIQPNENLKDLDHDKILVCDETFLGWVSKNMEYVEEQKIYNVLSDMSAHKKNTA